MNLKVFDLSAIKKVIVLSRIVGLKFKAVSTSVVIGPLFPSSLKSLNPLKGQELMTFGSLQLRVIVVSVLDYHIGGSKN